MTGTPGRPPRAGVSTTPVSPVTREAARLGVDVSAVNGTGVGGRVSLADVRAAAGPRYRPPALHATARATAAASNPLVAHARSIDPAACAEADRRGPAPTLFTAGDLPPLTASGMDPTRLLDVPPQARHALAAATGAEALALHERYATAGATVNDYRVVGHAGWTAYASRVSAWLGTACAPRHGAQHHERRPRVATLDRRQPRPPARQPRGTGNGWQVAAVAAHT